MQNGPRSRNRCGHGMARNGRGWAQKEITRGEACGIDVKRMITPHTDMERLPESHHQYTVERTALPEGERAGNNLVAIIDSRTCTVCGACAGMCPAGAITVDDTVNIDMGKCLECGRCVSECPQGAITIKRL